MAQITLSLPTDVALALGNFAVEFNLSLQEAAIEVLREGLVGTSYRQTDLFDVQSETEGSDRSAGNAVGEASSDGSVRQGQHRRNLLPSILAAYDEPRAYRR